MRPIKRIHGASAHPIIKQIESQNKDYTRVAPDGISLRFGERILYTNPQGVKFAFTVLGFDSKPQDGRDTYIFTDCWWLPARHHECTPLPDGEPIPNDVWDYTTKANLTPDRYPEEFRLAGIQ